MKPGTLWPWVIGGALLLHVVVMLAVVFVNTSNSSYAVEEDYYQKAIDWDQKRAQDRTNTALGWTLAFDVAPPATPGEMPVLEVRVHDVNEQPIADATVALEAFHKARSDDVIRIPLQAADEPGRYLASPEMRNNGLWELRFTVLRGEETFTYTETRHLFVEGSW